jgi:hypothetical protein
MAIATSKGVAVSLFAAATTGTGTAVAVPISSDHQRVIVTGAGTIAGGTLIIEEANLDTYTGTWSTLYTVTGTALTAGAQQVLHIFGTLGFIRARIGTNVSGAGGTLAAEIVTN